MYVASTPTSSTAPATNTQRSLWTELIVYLNTYLLTPARA
jgi:hypothetical protein